MTRTLEAKLLLKGDDKTGKATGSAARGLENVAKTAKRAEDAWKRASAAQRAMATNVRTNAREVERLQRAVSVQAGQHEQQIRRISGAMGRLKASSLLADGAVLGVSTRFVAAAGTVVAATKALNDYADAQNRFDRIGITGDADEKTVEAAKAQVRAIAQDVALPFQEVTGGLDTMVAAGMSVEEAMGLLPAAARAAQASGADIRDITASAVSLGDAFEITAGRIEHAFDIMAHGGKLGKFELKDMAQYFPSLAPLAATRGYTGEEGLKRVVAMLQVIRGQTGTAEQAYNGLRDLLSKMETDESSNRFEDFNVDIRKWMEDARNQGRDEVEAFLDAVTKAIGTDYAKLPQLIGEQDSRNAVLALLRGRDELAKYIAELGNSDGTVGRDLARITDNLEQGFVRVRNAINEVSTAAGKMMESFGLPEGLRQTTATLETIAGQLEVIAGREGGLVEKLTGRKDGFLEKLAEPVGPDGLVSKSLFGWINERTGGSLDWIVDDSERVTPAVGDGSPGALYEHPIQQAAADAASATADFLLGQKRTPVPAPAPTRAPPVAPFPMKPDDLSQPILVDGLAVPAKRPGRDAAVPPMPWDAYTLPRGRPVPEAIAAPIPAAALAPPVAPTGLPFQMRAEDGGAPIVTGTGPLPQAVQGLATSVDGAADAVDRFSVTLGGGTAAGGPPAPPLNEMDDDALLAALSGATPVATAVDGIGDAADEAADKLGQLPGAVPVGEMATAGRLGGEAFAGAFGQALAAGVRAAFAGAAEEARAGAARLGAAASVSVNPTVSRRPRAVDANRGDSMANISETLP